MTIISPLPYVLANGATADATQVNADFNQIVNNVNSNAAASGANNDITALSAMANPPLPLTVLTDSLENPVAMAVVDTWYDGPSCAQGAVGKWLAVGTVTIQDFSVGSSVITFEAQLTDGTTIITGTAGVTQQGRGVGLAVSGVFSAPAGNLRIRCKALNTTTSQIISDTTGSGNKDSTLTVVRIG